MPAYFKQTYCIERPEVPAGIPGQEELCWKGNDQGSVRILRPSARLLRKPDTVLHKEERPKNGRHAERIGTGKAVASKTSVKASAGRGEKQDRMTMSKQSRPGLRRRWYEYGDQGRGSVEGNFPVMFCNFATIREMLGDLRRDSSSRRSL